MPKGIPVIGRSLFLPCRQPTIVFLLAITTTFSQLIGVANSAGIVYEPAQPNGSVSAVDNGQVGVSSSGLRPVFFSELKLRQVIQSTNYELRQLKRDFMKQMTDDYLGFKLNSKIGFERAKTGTSSAASANLLMAEEFADIVMKKHIIQRRLLTGLKLAYLKFLPMQTLVSLYRRYKSFEWLIDQTQVDLRPKFPEATGKFRSDKPLQVPRPYSRLMVTTNEALN